MRATLALAFAAVLIVAPVALANEGDTSRAFLSDYSKMPNFLVDTACKAYGRGQKVLENLCLSSEQSSYDILKEMWSKIPDNVKRQCYEVVMPIYEEAPYATPDRFGYSAMAQCFIPAMEAEDLKNQPPFQR